MTKAELAEKIQFTTGMTKRESAETMEAVFAIMKRTLEAGENLKLSGFGNFEVRHKANRRGRNPQTGETISIEQRKNLTFKPSGTLKQAINEQA